jgi:transcriptional regulator with XRE-family HTH domain
LNLDNLKALRESAGLTQIDLAKIVGVSLSSYRMWEAGVTVPNDKNMSQLKLFLEGMEECQDHA